jgi:hypothetical protein
MSIVPNPDHNPAFAVIGIGFILPANLPSQSLKLRYREKSKQEEREVAFMVVLAGGGWSQFKRQRKNSVADPDPGSGACLTPGPGMVKKSGFGSEMNNPDHIFESLETIFWVKILKFFDADSGTGMEKIRIRDKNPGSATLQNKLGVIFLFLFNKIIPL